MQKPKHRSIKKRRVPEQSQKKVRHQSSEKRPFRFHKIHLFAALIVLAFVAFGFVGYLYIDAQIAAKLDQRLQKQTLLPEDIDLGDFKKLLRESQQAAELLQSKADAMLLEAAEANNSTILFRDSAQQALQDVTVLKTEALSKAELVEKALLDIRGAQSKIEQARSMTEVAAIDADMARNQIKSHIDSIVTDALFVKGFAERGQGHANELENLVLEVSGKRRALEHDLKMLENLSAEMSEKSRQWELRSETVQAVLKEFSATERDLAVIKDKFTEGLSEINTTKASAEFAANEAALQADMAEQFRDQLEVASRQTEQLRQQLNDAVAIADQAAKDVIAFKRTAAVLAHSVRKYRESLGLKAAGAQKDEPKNDNPG